MVTKRKCNLCGHHKSTGCNLITAICANTESRPSFVYPEDLNMDTVKLKLAGIPVKSLRSPFCNIANKEGKEFDYGTFGSKGRALKTSKEEAAFN